MLENLLHQLNRVIDSTQKKDVHLFAIIKEYNQEHSNCMFAVNNATLKITEFLCYLAKCSETQNASIKANATKEAKMIEPINAIQPQIPEDIHKNTLIESSIKQPDDKKLEPTPEVETPSTYQEDTLIISEFSNKVILPYTLSKVQDEYENHKDTYSSIDDVIQKKYTLSLHRFKNPFIARFKEAYQLMRNKEKASISKSFDLGLEFMFRYHLHPAIITACNSLDELDDYLDSISKQENSKFSYFKVLFEIPPAVIKANRE